MWPWTQGASGSFCNSPGHTGVGGGFWGHGSAGRGDVGTWGGHRGAIRLLQESLLGSRRQGLEVRGLARMRRQGHAEAHRPEEPARPSEGPFTAPPMTDACRPQRLWEGGSRGASSPSLCPKVTSGVGHDGTTSPWEGGRQVVTAARSSRGPHDPPAGAPAQPSVCEACLPSQVPQAGSSLSSRQSEGSLAGVLHAG